MAAQTLNIIYDTNYTSIVPDGGFVDRPFTKKLWFWDLLFWDLSWKKDDSKNTDSKEKSSTTQQDQDRNQQDQAQNMQESQQVSQQAQDSQQNNWQQNQQPQTNGKQQSGGQQEKSPWFFDLLFWDLSKKPNNSQKENTSENNKWTENKPTPQANATQQSQEQNNTPAQQTQTTTPAPSVQTDTTVPWAQVPPISNVIPTTDTQSTADTVQQPAVNTDNQTANNDTNIPNWAATDTLNVSSNDINESEPKKKKSWIDSMLDSVFWPDDWDKKENKKDTKKEKKADESKSEKEEQKKISAREKEANELRDQIKKILEIPDSEYKDSMLTSDMRRFIKKVDEEYTANIADFKSHIAPSYWEYKSNEMNISGILWKTYYTQRYPTYIDALWTRDLMTMHSKWDMSFFIYPEDDAAMQAMLKRKSTQLKAELNEAMSKWITTDKEVEQQYRDVELIREKLSTREERYFELSNYFTIYNTDENLLKEEWKKYEQKVSGYGISVKTANHRMDEWMTSTLPLCIDDLWISRSAVTSSLAWSFPFISNDLVQNTWIFYGLNLHTWWLIIMDRFSNKLPNMNSVILATSWAWKSFTVKLEVLRYLLNWIDIIVIDPENEYKDLCEAVDWTYINIATNAQQYINPFDLPPKIEDVEYGKWDLLRSQIMTLIWLIQILIWKLTPEEEAILDKALQNTYALRGFSLQDDDYEWKQPPLMEDLMNILNWMEWWEQVWLRLSKYVTWTFGKLFNNYTNVDINNRITVFSIRDLEDALKTPAMYNVLNFIRTKVRSMKRQRLLVCDEAWIMLQNDVSANFMFSMTKRARKYWLWITTISQDIEDFVRSPYGKPIVSNSSIQILLKQSTTSIKSLNQLLGLSEAEQQKLISCGVWEWLIFAGNQHIALKIVASPTEKELITTDVKKRSL